MTSNIAIQDLDLTHELSDKAMSEVRGGINFSGIGSQLQEVGGAGGFLSPVTNVGVYQPIVTQIGDTNVNVNLSSVTSALSDMAAAIKQG
ncbi:hypothetical protein [Pararobbsia silviterrae]|nr:hypothetical protein [Pararobbsia silviterrae]